MGANRHCQLLVPLVGKTEAPSDSRSPSGTYELPKNARRGSVRVSHVCYHSLVQPNHIILLLDLSKVDKLSILKVPE